MCTCCTRAYTCGVTRPTALERRPMDAQAFAMEVFGQHDLKDRVHAVGDCGRIHLLRVI